MKFTTATFGVLSGLLAGTHASVEKREAVPQDGNSCPESCRGVATSTMVVTSTTMVTSTAWETRAAATGGNGAGSTSYTTSVHTTNITPEHTSHRIPQTHPALFRFLKDVSQRPETRGCQFGSNFGNRRVTVVSWPC